MLNYQINQPQQLQSSKDIQPKVKKPRKCSQRSTKRSLKNEFEKLLIPAFASKVARNYTEKLRNKDTIVLSKKSAKVLPDNLAEFIIDNESSHSVISEEDYMKSMQILTKTTNRKNQIMQICQLLGIEKETIRKQRKCRTQAMQMRVKVHRPRRKKAASVKEEDEDNSTMELLSSEDILNSSINSNDDHCPQTPTDELEVNNNVEMSENLTPVDMDISDNKLPPKSPSHVPTPTFLQLISENLAQTVADYACLFFQF